MQEIINHRQFILSKTQIGKLKNWLVEAENIKSTNRIQVFTIEEIQEELSKREK